MWSYQPEIARLGTGFGLGKSPDGRLCLWDRAEWERQRQAAEVPAANPALWKTIKPTGSWNEQKFPFFADDRKLISLKQQPIRVEMDFGRESWSKSPLDRGAVPDQDRAPIRLKTGPNLLLLKITQGGGGWSACARIVAADGTPIPGLRGDRQGEAAP